MKHSTCKYSIVCQVSKIVAFLKFCQRSHWFYSFKSCALLDCYLPPNFNYERVNALFFLFKQKQHQQYNTILYMLSGVEPVLNNSHTFKNLFELLYPLLCSIDRELENMVFRDNQLQRLSLWLCQAHC